MTHAVIKLFLGLYVACGTVLLKPYVIYIYLHLAIYILQFKQKKLDDHVTMANTINCYCLTNRIFEEKWKKRIIPPAKNLHQTMILRGCICDSNCDNFID